ETEAQLVAEASRDEADAEAAGVPERAERARPVAELVETRLAPNEVVAFLACGIQQLLASRGAARADRLSRIKRLRGDLAGVIDAHQRGAQALLVARERRVFHG